MAMTLRLTEEETAALRAQADAEHRSMHDVARAAIREYTAQRAHRARVLQSWDRVSRQYGTTLRDLADR